MLMSVLSLSVSRERIRMWNYNPISLAGAPLHRTAKRFVHPDMNFRYAQFDRKLNDSTIEHTAHHFHQSPPTNYLSRHQFIHQYPLTDCIRAQKRFIQFLNSLDLQIEQETITFLFFCCVRCVFKQNAFVVVAWLKVIAFI